MRKLVPYSLHKSVAGAAAALLWPWLGLVFVALALSFGGQNAFRERAEYTQVKLLPAPIQPPGWSAVGADLIATRYEIQARLQIQNVADEQLSATRWYVEYQDAAEVPCFSMLFASDTMVPGVGRAVTLSSYGSSLAPAVKPLNGIARLVAAGDAGEALAPYISAPPGLMSPPESAFVYQATPGDGVDKPGNYDLALVRVSLSRSGGVDHVEPLASLSPQASAWAVAVSKNLRFVPCMQGSEPRTCKTLLLYSIRWPGYDDQAKPPSDLRWVKEAVDGTSFSNADDFAMRPVVHTLVYMPKQVHSASEQEAKVTRFELTTSASEWSGPLLETVYVREWNAFLRRWH